MSAAVVILGSRDVASLLDSRSCVAAIDRALRAHEAGQTRGPQSTGFALSDGSFHVKAAALTEGERTFVAAKANVNLPNNPTRRDRPAVQGVLVLLDGDDGRPLAIIDSRVLTSVRTAAVAALAADRLARQDADTVTIVGCGEQGHSQLRGMAAVRALRLAYVIDRDAEKARAFAKLLSAELGFPITQTTDLSGALRASQICVTCTPAHEPFIELRHLHPGLFIAAVGADNPGKQEIAAEALSRARVVVDSLAACAAGGDLHHAITAGVMTERDVHAELSAIVGGRTPGRSSPDEIFVFDSVGTALQDVAAAALVYQRALASGRGMHISLGER